MRGAGRAMFAAFLLLIVGTINIVYGIGALDDAFALCIYVVHGLFVLGEDDRVERGV